MREDGPVLRGALEFEDEGQSKIGRLKRILKKQVEAETWKMLFAAQNRLLTLFWLPLVDVNLATLSYWGFYPIENFILYFIAIIMICKFTCFSRLIVTFG